MLCCVVGRLKFNINPQFLIGKIGVFFFWVFSLSWILIYFLDKNKFLNIIIGPFFVVLMCAHFRILKRRALIHDIKNERVTFLNNAIVFFAATLILLLVSGYLIKVTDYVFYRMGENSGKNPVYFQIGSRDTYGIPPNLLKKEPNGSYRTVDLEMLFRLGDSAVIVKPYGDSKAEQTILYRKFLGAKIGIAPACCLFDIKTKQREKSKLKQK